MLTQYAGSFEVYGIDYNRAILRTASRNLKRDGLQAALQQADVCLLRCANESVDTIVNTMAFSGYPDGRRALAEMKRVLKPGGRLIMVDVSYPPDQNWLGMSPARFWEATGDILRDMQALFDAMWMACSQKEIGGLGTVQLYVAERP